jgi:sirohydrochlorin cobaltochelatase
MHSPIILTASGTSPAAKRTCNHIETSVRKRFSAHDIYWGYSSRVVRQEVLKDQNATVRQPADIAFQLAAEGHRQVIIQSLHLIPGHEFHALQQEVRQIVGMNCLIGMPLLYSPTDYTTYMELLAPYIQQRPDRAVLIVGHGTRHAVWPIYLALESMLQSRFGSQVFMGVVEHFPCTDDVEERIAAAGFKEVLMIPFFLVAGMHFRRDMIGDQPGSWKQRLEKRGLQVEVVADGVGLLPGIGELVADHIAEAMSRVKE